MRYELTPLQLHIVATNASTFLSSLGFGCSSMNYIVIFKLTDKVFPTTRLVASDGDFRSRSIFFAVLIPNSRPVPVSSHRLAATFCCLSGVESCQDGALFRVLFAPKVSNHPVPIPASHLLSFREVASRAHLVEQDQPITSVRRAMLTGTTLWWSR